MNDREKWRERVRDIRASVTTWWWSWLLSFSSNRVYNCLVTASCPIKDWLILNGCGFSWRLNLYSISLLGSRSISIVQTLVSPLLPKVASWGGQISFSTTSHLARKIWNHRFFFYLVIFNYCCHSPVTGWPTTSVLSRLTQGSTGHSFTLCLLKAFFSFFFRCFFLFLLSQKICSLFFFFNFNFLYTSQLHSSSSCHAGSTDIPDSLSPLFPIVHRLRQVFRRTSCIRT